MLANLVKSIFPGNSPPTFEQARLQATYDGDTNPPIEKDLTIILTAFQDRNPDIRGTAAFYLTLATMQANKAAKPWNYILKNFILFDRSMDEKCFAKEISELELEQLGNYKPTSGKHGEKLDLLLKRYFRYLKAKGRIFYTKHFHFNVSNERQKSDLAALSPDKLFLETKRLRSLIILAFDVFASGIQEITKYKLNQFIFTLVLNTLTKIFALQKLILSILYDSMSSLQSNKVLELYEAIKEYMMDVDSLTSHCNNLNNLPGFQMSQEQIFDPEVGRRMLKKLNNHLANLYKNLSVATPKAPEISFSFHVESTVPQHRGDELITEADDHHSWEEVQRLSVRSGEGYNSPIRAGSPRVRTPKSMTKTFKESFHYGFKYSMNHNVKLLSRLDTKEDAHGRNRKDTISLNNEFVPGLFDELLCLEEPNDLFYGFKNFYSADYADIPKVEANPRVINIYDEEEAKRTSKGHAYHHRNFVKRISFDIAEVEDFDQELFDNYKNNYSSDC